MADMREDENKRLNQWVLSLAITIVCCAIFFLVFAGYFLRVQERLIEMQVRVELNDSRIAALENNYLFMAQRAALAPPPAPIPVPQHAAPTPPVPSAAPPPEAPAESKVVPPVSPVVPSNEALLLDTKVAAPVGVVAPVEPPKADKGLPKPSHHKPVKPKPAPKADE